MVREKQVFLQGDKIPRTCRRGLIALDVVIRVLRNAKKTERALQCIGARRRVIKGYLGCNTDALGVKDPLLTLVVAPFIDRKITAAGAEHRHQKTLFLR
ncbi:hypothetical protein D3C84_676940 [compost metagenome]